MTRVNTLRLQNILVQSACPKRSKVALLRVIKECTRFLPLLFCFDQHGLSVPDSINEFPNRVRPAQMSHTTASDLGIIDCFIFDVVDCRNTRV